MPYIDFTAHDQSGYDCTLRVWYTEVTDQASNASVISVDKCQFKSSHWVGHYSSGGGTIKINGAEVINWQSIPLRTSEVYLYSVDTFYDLSNSTGDIPVTIIHNTDGTGIATMECTASMVTDSSDRRWSCGLQQSDFSLTPIARQFLLSVSPGTGSSITVQRNGTIIYSGAEITYGDVLTITFDVSTGYNLVTHTVNGYDFTSGNTYTVTGAVSVVTTTTVLSFLLSLSEGTYTAIAVGRASSPLGGGSIGEISNGDTIYYGDILFIYFSTITGCTLFATVNGVPSTSGDSHTVTGAVNVVTTATVNSYSLSMSASGRITLSCLRTSSPFQGAAQGYLSNGETIYYGDVLSVAFEVSTGSTISVHTINGVDFSSGYVHTVTAAVAVIVSATLNEYQITRSVGVGASLVIQRNASPYGQGSLGILTGDTVYYGDELQLTVQASSGYAIDSMEVNNIQYYDNPHIVTVISALVVSILASVLGFVRIDSGAEIGKYRILIDSGSSHEQYRVMIDNGSEIVPY